ncbi:hemagglutinin-neuraminidase protein [avian paramyxovirus 20]|uniref:Hemagglutinin-neuraminidase n=1 Tax=avian paramyxovirus 20 TaxID=2560314 RepID=A0A2I6ECF6_9MONO|nr:hemagglutinin-neuraminidase protein [Avian metaavulavirus 20]AUJ87607.1 hemagglutinin-neuraminidase protein [Avian metaavulavirus 20]
MSTADILSHIENYGQKNTWRSAFRITSLILLLLITGMTIAGLVIASNQSCATSEELADPITEKLITSIRDLLTVSNNQINDIFKIVALDIPLQVSSIQQDISSQFNKLMEGITSLIGYNNSAGVISTIDPSYSGGIGVPLFTTSGNSTLQIHPVSLIEHPSFIPNPTTNRGCTRIPTFHLSRTHWCYSHNVIAKGCADFGKSGMYISLGVIKTAELGTPVFLTTASQYVDDGVNRKSCSIAATRFGCDILCSIVTEKENDDYASDPPTEMVHGRLFFNGTFSDSNLDVKNLFRDFSANYPSVGSGEVIGDIVMFPFYGGVRQRTSLFDQLSQFGLFVHNNRYTCEQNWTMTTVKQSYLPPKISGRFWAQGIVKCRLVLQTLANCSISVFNSSKVMMGAEARLMLVGTTLYMYQRSSSWWPLGLTYILGPMHSYLVNEGLISQVTLIAHSKFPRPSNKAGYCARPSVCPAVCATGVYTDLWPITESSNASNIVWVGQYLDAITERKYPRIGVATQYDWIHQSNLFSSNTVSSYSTTTCFKNTRLNRSFCVIIAEFTDGLFGEYRIVPQLIELRVK